MICVRSLAAPLLLAAAAGASAQPFPPAPADQTQRIAGWRVAHQAEADGGRIVRMTRMNGGYRLAYHASFWRGNAGPYSGVSVERRGRSCGGQNWKRDPNGAFWRAESDVASVSRTVRASFAEFLAACGRRPRSSEADLAGFERAFALAAEYSEVARVATMAEAEAIESYGREQGAPATDPAGPH